MKEDYIEVTVKIVINGKISEVKEKRVLGTDEKDDFGYPIYYLHDKITDYHQNLLNTAAEKAGMIIIY